MPDTPCVEELLTLDLLTLRAHTERAGDKLEEEPLRIRLNASLAVSETCTVRRGGALVAYAMLRPESATSWFVTGFNTHPAHRTSVVLFDLFVAFADVVRRHGIAELRSHVYKTNLLSMAFHRRLGFRVTRENAKGVEFFATMADVMASPAFEKTARRLANAA